MKDEIIEELWRVKDQIDAETKGNTQTLFERLRAVELAPSRRCVVAQFEGEMKSALQQELDFMIRQTRSTRGTRPNRNPATGAITNKT